MDVGEDRDSHVGTREFVDIIEHAGRQDGRCAADVSLFPALRAGAGPVPGGGAARLREVPRARAPHQAEAHQNRGHHLAHRHDDCDLHRARPCVWMDVVVAGVQERPYRPWRTSSPVI